MNINENKEIQHEFDKQNRLIRRVEMTEKLDLLALNQEAFRKKVLVGNGHGLFAPDHYKDVGFPEGFLPVERHHSQDSHKGTIFVDGIRVEHMDAVYHLELLHKICSELGLKYHDAMGRGFQARNYVDAIKHHINDDPNYEDPPETKMGQVCGE